MRAVLEIKHQEETSSEWSSQAYDVIYNTMAIQHLTAFYQWFLELLDVKSGRRFLDVACGVGILPTLAKKAGLEAHGLDFSSQAIYLAQNNEPAVHWVIGNGEQLPYPPSSFDYVTSIGSLEHYLRPHIGVGEISRVLNSTGYACILLPNTFGILGNVWTALRTGRTFDDGQPIQRYAARYEWQELLEENGLHVIRTIKYERILPKSFHEAKWYLHHPKDLARLILGIFVPLNWADYFVYICTKAS